MLESEQFVSDPTPQSPMFISVNMCSVGNMLDALKQVGFGVSDVARQMCVCTFGSRRMP